MTSDQLSAIAGVALSLLLAYVPGLNEWFGSLTPIRKRMVLAACLLAAAGGSLVLACVPPSAGVLLASTGIAMWTGPMMKRAIALQ